MCKAHMKPGEQGVCTGRSERVMKKILKLSLRKHSQQREHSVDTEHTLHYIINMFPFDLKCYMCYTATWRKIKYNMRCGGISVVKTR